MNSSLAFKSGLVLAALTLAASSQFASAINAPGYDFVNPAGWTAGDPLSTYQEWASGGNNTTASILWGPGSVSTPNGAPTVASNSAGASLPPSVLSVSGGGFVASSGGFYSFSSHYQVTAAIENHAPVSPPANAGTHVIVQTYSGINPDTNLSVRDLNIVDSSNAAIPGAVLLRSDVYGSGTATIFGFETGMQATIHEFWLPNFTGDFKALIGMNVHSSFQGIQVDSEIASAAGGTSPFAVTAVPEPTVIGLAGVGLIGLLSRRRTKRG